jgi:polyphosphate kinase 2 (PPK2 family)
MLEEIDLSQTFDKQQYKTRLPQLQQRLYDVQKACWDAQIPTVALFEGWDAAGKGGSIRLLTRLLDPRGFQVHPISPARRYERARPWLWRFWQRLPNYGELAIFDRSWYGRVLAQRVEKRISKKKRRRAYRDIVEFERQLADDGYVIVKFWLHISKKEQKRRLQELEQDPLNCWRVTPEDWAQHKKYKRYKRAVEKMLARTTSEYAPWTVVAATDRHWMRVKIFETLIAAMESALEQRGAEVVSPEAADLVDD